VAIGERVRKTVAALVLVLLAVDVTLSFVAHDPWPSSDGVVFVTLVAYAAVGYVIARTEPRNPIGWLFLVFALAGAVMADAAQGWALPSPEGSPGLPACWPREGSSSELAVPALSQGNWLASRA